MTDPPSLPHSRAFELLPWLVNGTLAGAERDAVEQHARTCIACRRELKEQQRLHAAVRARRTVDVSAEAGFDRLERRARRRGARRAAALASPLRDGRSVRGRGGRRHGRARDPAVVHAVARARRDNYSTLATPAAETPPCSTSCSRSDTTAAEMQALLDDIGGEIVAGPSELGRYSVRVAGDATERTRSRAARRLWPPTRASASRGPR